MKSSPDVFLCLVSVCHQLGSVRAGITVTGTGSAQLSLSGRRGSTLSSLSITITITTGNHLSASLGEILHPQPESRFVSLLSRRCIINIITPWHGQQVLNQNFSFSTRDLFIRNMELDPWLPPSSGSWGLGLQYLCCDGETHWHLISPGQDTWAIRCCKNIPSDCDKWSLIPRQDSSCKTSNNAELCPASPLLQWSGLSISVWTISLLWQGLVRVQSTHHNCGLAI